MKKHFRNIRFYSKDGMERMQRNSSKIWAMGVAPPIGEIQYLKSGLIANGLNGKNGLYLPPYFTLWMKCAKSE